MAKAILAGTMPRQPQCRQSTPTDLAEQMLWATGDPEIVRCACPTWKRPRAIQVELRPDLRGQADKFKLLLDDGIDPDVVGDEFTILHHLATDSTRSTV